MSTLKDDSLSSNLATIFEEIVWCAKVGGYEAAKGERGNPLPSIENIKELLKQCEVLAKEQGK
jgi:hypothetical protein